MLKSDKFPLCKETFGTPCVLSVGICTIYWALLIRYRSYLFLDPERQYRYQWWHINFCQKQFLRPLKQLVQRLLPLFKQVHSLFIQTCLIFSSFSISLGRQPLSVLIWCLSAVCLSSALSIDSRKMVPTTSG